MEKKNLKLENIINRILFDILYIYL